MTGDGKIAGLNGVSHDTEGEEDIKSVAKFKQKNIAQLQLYRILVCLKTPAAVFKCRGQSDAYMYNKE